MRMGNFRVRATLVAGFIGSLTLPLRGQVATPAATAPASNPVAGDPKAITQGAVLFRQECVFCHGVAARGGMRGPDLTTGSWSHGGSDAELAATISAGERIAITAGIS
jgi:mono/diheme cytochrome c family protein